MSTARKLGLAVRPVPEGYHTVTVALTVKDCERAIAFYRSAFGAELVDRMYGPDGKSVVHASLKLGDSMIFLSDEFPGFAARAPETLGGSSCSVYLYVKDADGAFDRAVKAGCTVKHPLMDAFWGDRCGTVTDPFGYQWDLATHVEDVKPEEMKRRAEAFNRELAKGLAGKGKE
jgi:uncharacterized glyoxalase superfamily protein PhnB